MIRHTAQIICNKKNKKKRQHPNERKYKQLYAGSPSDDTHHFALIGQCNTSLGQGQVFLPHPRDLGFIMQRIKSDK